MSTNYINQVTDTNGTTHDIGESVDTRIFRATCSTAADTAAKVATLDDSTNYTLAEGVRVAVTFTYGNSATTPTLNVNSGGAKTIVTPTAVATLSSGNGTTYNTWGPYETVIFTYNGTYWVKGGTGYSTYKAYSLANSHTHGNITNGGDITATAPTVANGDQIIINDHSASKITNGPTFDGSTTTTALTPKGTWESFSKFSGSYSDLSNKPTIPTNVSDLTNDSGFVTTDEKLAISEVYPNSTYNVLLGSGTSANTRQFSPGLNYMTISGDPFNCCLQVGYSNQGNGSLKLTNNSGFSSDLFVDSTLTENRELKIPDKSGTIALTSDIPTKTSDLTNDSGFLTSYTDTKVTQTPLNGTNSGKNILLAYNLSRAGSTAADTNGVYKATYMTYNDYSPSLTLTNRSDSTKTATLTSSGLNIQTGDYYVNINTNTQTSNHNINLPDASGTVALTSDIPTTNVISTSDDENGNITLGYTTTDIDHLLMNQLTIQDSNDIDFFVVNPTENDLLLRVDTTAASGTLDGDIYANLVALGWDSEVIE